MELRRRILKMFCSIFSSLRDCVPSFYSVGAVFGRSDDLVLDPSVTLAHFENALVDIEKIAPGKWGWATWQLLSLLRNIPEAILCNTCCNALQFSWKYSAILDPTGCNIPQQSERGGGGAKQSLGQSDIYLLSSLSLYFTACKSTATPCAIDCYVSGPDE